MDQGFSRKIDQLRGYQDFDDGEIVPNMLPETVFTRRGDGLILLGSCMYYGIHFGISLGYSAMKELVSSSKSLIESSQTLAKRLKSYSEHQDDQSYRQDLS